MKQAGQILLQTTPTHIDVAELEAKLKKAFPALVQIHDFHVWALTPERVIATAHLLFMNEQVYLRIKDSINDFFLSHGITRATLQPEFYKVIIQLNSFHTNNVFKLQNIQMMGTYVYLVWKFITGPEQRMYPFMQQRIL